MTNEIEPYNPVGLSPAQLQAGMDPLERVRAEADNGVAAVVHERFDTERKLRELVERHREADEAWTRMIKTVKKRRKGADPSAQEYAELEELAATRRSLEWQVTQYRTRHDDLVQMERELQRHRVDLAVAADEMRVEVDTIRHQQVVHHAQSSMVQIQNTMRRLSSEIGYAKRERAYGLDGARAQLIAGRPLSSRLGQAARDIDDALYSD